MIRCLEILRGGGWLTRERMRLMAIAVLIAGGGGLVYLAATAHGLTDFKGRPLGTDFSSFYAAGTYALGGHSLAAYDPSLHYAREQALFGAATPYYSWLYPPYFLLLAAALALLPYLPALILWQGASLAGYLVAMRTLVRSATPAPPDRLWLLLAVAYPAVLVNLGHGQNGLLTAALLAGGLAVLPRRPVLAGVMFGLMVYKPQFGLMIPLALIAGGYWRAFLAAAATVVLFTLATTTAFGVPIWPAFLAAARIGRTLLLESGADGWYRTQSVLGWVHLWGGSSDLAYALQGAVTLAAAAAVVWLWRSSARYALKAAGLAVATLVAALHSNDYDLMVVAPAIAFLALDGMGHGFRPYEKSLLAAVWLVPLVTRSIAAATALPLGTMATLALLGFIVRKAAPRKTAPAPAALPQT